MKIRSKGVEKGSSDLLAEDNGVWEQSPWWEVHGRSGPRKLNILHIFYSQFCLQFRTGITIRSSE